MPVAAIPLRTSLVSDVMGVAGPITTLSPINVFFAIPTPPAVTMLPVEVEELAVVAEKFTAPVNVAPERAAYCERVAPLSAMILPVVPENTAILVNSSASICYKIVDC